MTTKKREAVMKPSCATKHTVCIVNSKAREVQLPKLFRTKKSRSEFKMLDMNLLH